MQWKVQSTLAGQHCVEDGQACEVLVNICRRYDLLQDSVGFLRLSQEVVIEVLSRRACQRRRERIPFHRALNMCKIIFFNDGGAQLIASCPLRKLLKKSRTY
jgi:hypothetical protein